MSLPAFFYWAVLSIEYTVTATGVELRVKTNHACHMWMRFTLENPWVHIITKDERGVPLGKDIRTCFVAYHSNEQEEGGDTIFHTFTKEPWPHCETRWFYFYATVTGEFSPSESAVFHYHRVYVPEPVTVEFHPDAHPETSSVDGYASAVKVPTVLWAAIHGDTGTAADDSDILMYVELRSSSRVNKWYKIHRIIITFDTSSIPVGATILSAKLELHLGDDLLRLAPIAINVFASDPIANNALESQDYSRTFNVPCSTEIPLPDDSNYRWETFEFLEACLYFIIKAGITKLAIRESWYDAPNNTPTWYISGYAYAFIHTAETPGPYLGPKLIVTYLP